MRPLLLLAAGGALEALNGAVCRMFRLEWFRLEPLLTLLVYAAVAIGGPASLLVAFGLGLLADSLGGTPLGARTCGYLILWALLHSVRGWLLPETTFSRVLVVFAAGVLLGLLSLAYPLLAGTTPGAVKIQLIAWLPVSAGSAGLSPLLWLLARAAWPEPAPRLAGRSIGGGR